MTTSSALLLVLLSMTLLPFSTNGELTITSNGHDDLLEMLNTEQALIDGLRHFIQVQEQKLNILRRYVCMDQKKKLTRNG